MSDIQLGKLISQVAGEVQRDAIHVAIIPVIAGERLSPGAHVALAGDGSNVVTLLGGTRVGIIDPFLTRAVLQGELCWLMLYQNTVTGMRHHWSHPAFGDSDKVVATDEQGDVERSKKWLEGAAVRLGVSYDRLVNEWGELACGDYINNGENIRDIWYELETEFWKHRKIVTGKDVDENERGGFTCSC
jgi:hypothetical protein